MFSAAIYLTISRSIISLLLTNMAFRKGSLLKPSLSPSLTIGCLRWTNIPGQMYLLIDFSKAFDSVPHQRLLLKLNYYGITGNSLSWIENFLLDHTQCFQVSGTRSSWISVISGVPHGTVLGPLLFLIYINDIVHNLNSKIKLFADDAVLYSEVSNVHDVSLFQHNLDTLYCWAATNGK